MSSAAAVSPAVAEGVEHVMAVPYPEGVQCIEVLPAPPEVVEATIVWTSENGKSSSLGTTLQNFWNESHKMVKVDECGAEKHAVPETKCCTAGMCLCSDDGAEIVRRAATISGALKLPPKSRARAMLNNGSIVIQCVGVGSGTDLEADLETALTKSDTVNRWWHVGM